MSRFVSAQPRCFSEKCVTSFYVTNTMINKTVQNVLQRHSENEIQITTIIVEVRTTALDL